MFLQGLSILILKYASDVSFIAFFLIIGFFFNYCLFFFGFFFWFFFTVAIL